MKKGVFVMFLGVLLISFMSFGVLAQEAGDDKQDDELRCLLCGDSCVSSDEIATMFCNPPTGDVECGSENGECIVLSFTSFEDDDGTCGDFDCDELELRGHGINPDSAFYFIDEFFDRFGDDLEVKEEKIAEIKIMIEEGNFEAAREALQNYKEQVKELEKEIDPEKIEEAKKSAATIEKALDEIENELSEENKIEFFDDILNSERGIVTAAEIASKIKALCQALSDIDPVEYSRVCSAGDDAPRWQKALDKDLTDDQRKEAKNFGEIMSQCFRTSGQECRCDEIPYPDFANACSKAAPLAIACDVDGDEAACEKLDNLEMPKLPDHLQDIFEELDGEISEAQFDLHMPRECVEAGATSGKECGKIMIETNAPEECKQPLLDSGCDDERECREICDNIMMNIHAPECSEKGITDPEECKRFMDSFRGDDHGGPGGPRIDFNCKEISNAEERLSCYDKASSQATSYGGFDDENYDGNCMTESDWDAKKKECRALYGEHGGDEPIKGDSGSGYQCVIDARCVDFGNFEEGSVGSSGGDWKEGCENLDCGSNAWCEYGECHQYPKMEEPEHYDWEDDRVVGPPTCDGVECGETSHCEDGSCVGNDYGPGEGPGEPSDYEGEQPSPDLSPSEDSGDSGSSDSGDSGITGNAFLDYYN